MPVFGFGDKEVALRLKNLAREREHRSQWFNRNYVKELQRLALRAYIIILDYPIEPATQVGGGWRLGVGTGVIHFRNDVDSQDRAEHRNSRELEVSIKTRDLIPHRDPQTGECGRVRVFNFTEQTIPACVPVSAVQDNFGDYYILEPYEQSGAGEGTSTTTTSLPTCTGECKYVWNEAGNTWQLGTQTCGPPTTTSTTTSTTAAPCTGNCIIVCPSGTWQLNNACEPGCDCGLEILIGQPCTIGAQQGAPCGDGTTTTTTTTTLDPCSCGTTSTTTTTSQTTTDPDTTTTTENPCHCLPPTYCGTEDGECTYTQCSQGEITYIIDCETDDTTTTTPTPCSASQCSQICTNGIWTLCANDPPVEDQSDQELEDENDDPIDGNGCDQGCAHGCGCPELGDACSPENEVRYVGCETTTTCDCNTSTTSTSNPECAGGCDWLWIPTSGWAKINDFCHSSCPCPEPVPVGTNCQTAHTDCEPVEPIATTLPPVECTGGCIYWWLDVINQWHLTDYDCSLSVDCTCVEPSTPGNYCAPIKLPCIKLTTTTVNPNTTPPPCEDCYTTTTTSTTSTTTTTPNPSDCEGDCLWQCSSDVWNLIDFGCNLSQNCSCLPPSIACHDDCERARTICFQTTTTPAPTTTSTTITTSSTTTTIGPCETRGCSVQCLRNEFDQLVYVQVLDNCDFDCTCNTPFPIIGEPCSFEFAVQGFPCDTTTT